MKSPISINLYSRLLVNTYALNGQGLDAIKLYEEISTDLRDEYSHIAVLNGCSHAGLLQQAQEIFKNIKNKTRRIYTTMVNVEEWL